MMANEIKPNTVIAGAVVNPQHILCPGCGYYLTHHWDKNKAWKPYLFCATPDCQYHDTVFRIPTTPVELEIESGFAIDREEEPEDDESFDPNYYKYAGKNLNDAEYICQPCAERYGGHWPAGHVATWHSGTCDICAKKKGVANVGDWNWPGGKRRGMRD
jgi:hypothetical protein